MPADVDLPIANSLILASDPNVEFSITLMRLDCLKINYARLYNLGFSYHIYALTSGG